MRKLFLYLCKIKKHNQQRGRKIKKLRKSKGFSQEDMAEKLHISQSAYARISHSWAAHIEKLNEIFEVKPEIFLPMKLIIWNKKIQIKKAEWLFSL